MMFGISKIYLIIAAAIAIVAILGFVGYKGYHMGYEVSTSEWSAKYNKLVIDTQAATNAEILRQVTANAEATAHANQLIAELQSKNDDLQKTIDQNEAEANVDPTVRDGISKSGADRLNKIQ